MRPHVHALTAICIIAISGPPNGATAVSVPTDRSHELAQKAQKVETATCGSDVTNFRICHLNYPTGCSQAAKYDAYLNYLKNQIPAPNLPATMQVTIDEIRRLDKRTPDTLTRGNHAAHAGDLADLGEGNIAGIVGYLYYAMESGKESTNCQLVGPRNVDYHIGIGFDAALASRARAAQPSSRPDQSLLQNSVVVEMTPHYRATYHPKWAKRARDLLGPYLGRQVRVLGQLLADNEHLNAKDTCSYQGADKTKCWRMSVWEIHPVTQLYVCAAATTCAWNSGAWTKVDDQP